MICPGCGMEITTTHESKTERWLSTSIEISPEEECTTIEHYEHFGWELMSSQTVHCIDSHLENRRGGLYSITQTTNYVKLVFRRNCNMAHYGELLQLEAECVKIKEELDVFPETESPKLPPWRTPKKVLLTALTLCTAVLCTFGITLSPILLAASTPTATISAYLALSRRAEIKKHKEALLSWEESARISRAETEATIAKKTAEIYKKSEALLRK